MENTTTHGVPVIEFYTWSKTNGNTSARIYITIDEGQLVNIGSYDSVRFRVLCRVEVTKAKIKELGAIAKKGY